MRGWGDGCDIGAFERVVPSIVFFEVFETTLLPNRSVRAEGEILCGDPGDRWNALLTLRQGNRHGERTIKGICTGEPDFWSAVIPPAANSGPFSRGEAQLCADVRSFSGGVQTDRDQLCFGVDID